VTVGGRSLGEVGQLSIGEALAFFRGHRDRARGAFARIAAPILKEVRDRLRSWTTWGSSYLTLGRSADTLSGGEGQRIRLATQIGSRLVGVLYVLDEPSVGLHQRDNDRLLRPSRRSGTWGTPSSWWSTTRTRSAPPTGSWTWVREPGSTEGEVVAEGPVDRDRGVVGRLPHRGLPARREADPIPAERRPADPGRALVVRNARGHNLKGVDAAFPLGASWPSPGSPGRGSPRS
jgi:excinuclease ABC subunit A